MREKLASLRKSIGGESAVPLSCCACVRRCAAERFFRRGVLSSFLVARGRAAAATMDISDGPTKDRGPRFQTLDKDEARRNREVMLTPPSSALVKLAPLLATSCSDPSDRISYPCTDRLSRVTGDHHLIAQRQARAAAAEEALRCHGCCWRSCRCTAGAASIPGAERGVTGVARGQPAGSGRRRSLRRPQPPAPRRDAVPQAALHRAIPPHRGGHRCRSGAPICAVPAVRRQPDAAV